jgi:hypothetical protein
MSVKNKKEEWKTPEPIPYDINSKKSETSFCFTPSGDEIYFVTDNGKDNVGGKDIYSIKKLSERKWSKPLNAGTEINTLYDEESVRFSPAGDTLWFSSKGHDSMGGFDIFYSVRDQDGSWGPARNIGLPVNTPWDELFYHPCPVNGSVFYFSSNRSGGFGGLDIYTGTILPASEEAEVVLPEPVSNDTVGGDPINPDLVPDSVGPMPVMDNPEVNEQDIPVNALNEPLI